MAIEAYLKFDEISTGSPLTRVELKNHWLTDGMHGLRLGRVHPTFSVIGSIYSDLYVAMYDSLTCGAVFRRAILTWKSTADVIIFYKVMITGLMPQMGSAKDGSTNVKYDLTYQSVQFETNGIRGGFASEDYNPFPVIDQILSAFLVNKASY